MQKQNKTSILFVCLGNICRSPLAEGVFRNVLASRGLSDKYHVDSAATADWNLGSTPDPRSIAVGKQHGIDISSHICQQVNKDFLERFDLILGMDNANMQALREITHDHSHDRLHMMMNYALNRDEEIPDPYYGDDDGFLAVYLTLKAASEALCDRLEADTASALTSDQASSIT